jgi:endonuclease I
MRPSFAAMLLLLAFVAGLRASPSRDLYAETKGLSGEKLKAKLQDITSEHHKSLGYGETKDALMAIDQDPTNSNNVITLYERKSVPKTNYVKGDPSLAWDRGHVLPQSYGASDGRFTKSDLHNLFPSLSQVNSLRGSLYFDESDIIAEKIPDSAPLASYDSDSWEPPDELKGDIARIVFYMDTRYDGSDSKQDIKIAEVANRKKRVFANLRTLLDWHADDPVSAEERERNNEIYKAQSNRNPFVDRPEFAERIYNTWQLMFRRDRGLKNIDTPPPPKDWLYKLAPLQSNQ